MESKDKQLEGESQNDNNGRNSVETGMGKRLRLTWVVGHGGPGDIHGVEGDERPGADQTGRGLPVTHKNIGTGKHVCSGTNSSSCNAHNCQHRYQQKLTNKSIPLPKMVSIITDIIAKTVPYFEVGNETATIPVL